MSWLRRLFGDRDTGSAKGESELPALVAELRERCQDLEERLRWSDEKLRERSDSIYQLQQQYSVEHFGFQESMRNLKIERMRNAGMFADRDIVMSRAKALQQRIADLKDRLQKYEPVEDLAFDQDPIVREDA